MGIRSCYSSISLADSSTFFCKQIFRQIKKVPTIFSNMMSRILLHTMATPRAFGKTAYARWEVLHIMLYPENISTLFTCISVRSTRAQIMNGPLVADLFLWRQVQCPRSVCACTLAHSAPAFVHSTNGCMSVTGATNLHASTFMVA
jgi:hypothetical protein